MHRHIIKWVFAPRLSNGNKLIQLQCTCPPFQCTHSSYHRFKGCIQTKVRKLTPYSFHQVLFPANSLICMYFSLGTCIISFKTLFCQDQEKLVYTWKPEDWLMHLSNLCLWAMGSSRACPRKAFKRWSRVWPRTIQLLTAWVRLWLQQQATVEMESKTELFSGLSQSEEGQENQKP